MTINKGYSVDLSDINVVILACHKCQTSLHLAPSDTTNEPLERCPNCKADWFPSAIDRNTLHAFLGTLRELRKRAGVNMCHVRVEVSLPS